MKYYKCIWEGEDSDGFYYSEVKENEIQRQVIEIGENLYWATLEDEKDELFEFTDQPEIRDEEIAFAREHLDGSELTKEAFEEIWQKSKN